MLFRRGRGSGPHQDLEGGSSRHSHPAVEALRHFLRQHGILLAVAACLMLLLLASRGLRGWLHGGGSDHAVDDQHALTCVGKLEALGIDVGGVFRCNYCAS